MGLFDLLSDIRDVYDDISYNKSENERKKREIEEAKREARNYVQEGKEIYKDAKYDFSNYSYDVERKIEEHFSFKKEIANELSGNINPIIQNFKTFNIDSKVVAPTIPTSGSYSIHNSISIKSISNSFVGNADNISVINLVFDLARDLDEELSEARRNRNKAEEYKWKMEEVASKMRSAELKMKNVEHFIDDEHKVLNSFITKLRPMINSLKNEMQRNAFSKSEAEELKAISKIAECIVNLLSVKFLNNDFMVTEEYKMVFKSIKNMDEIFRNTPNISSDKSWVRTVLKSLDDTVVY